MLLPACPSPGVPPVGRAAVVASPRRAAAWASPAAARRTALGGCSPLPLPARAHRRPTVAHLDAPNGGARTALSAMTTGVNGAAPPGGADVAAPADAPPPASEAPPPDGASRLSSRGRSLLAPFPEYLQLAFAAADDPYDADTNPRGFISLSVAENRLSADLMADRLARRPPLPAGDLAYGNMSGTPDLRAALAALFSTSLLRGKRSIPVDAVHLASGAGAVIDLLSSVLADPGDGVLIPTPLYYGFVRDLASRAGVATVAAPMDAGTGFAITAAGLEAAWRANNRRVTPVPLRAVIICNPGNPTGAVMPRAEVAAVLAWARAKGLHAIFDEIYVHSTLEPPPLGGGGPAADRFVSVAEVLADAGEGGLGNDVHIVWSFSKDFCGNALRAGVLLTDNAAVQAVFSTVTYFSSVAADTQAALADALTDGAWLEGYFLENRRRLSSAAAAAAEAMREARPAGASITAVPPAAGFFLWTDLRPLLGAVSESETAAAAAARGVALTGGPDDAFAREYAVFKRLVRAKVLVTPGAQYCCEEAGWFRFCFASATEAEVRVAWTRIEDAFRPVPVYH